MTSVITFLAGFYLGALFFAILTVAARRKAPGSIHVGQRQGAGRSASRRESDNSLEPGSLPFDSLWPVFMEK